MTDFTIRPARRGEVKVIGACAGPSGGGKTYSLLLLARGLAGNDPVVVIDTEHGRSQIYADVGAPWEWMDFQPPFTPERYIDALKAAAARKPAVVVLDSISHEYEGEGGLFDIVEEHLQKKAGEDARKRAALSFQAWNVAKQRHKKLLLHMLRMPCHLLLGMRAQDKIELVKDGGQLKAVPKRSLTGLDGWEPICERRLPYEMTFSFLMLPDRPGVPRPLKPMPPTMAPLVPLDGPLGEGTGRRLAEWAAGESARSNGRRTKAARLTTELLEVAERLGKREVVAEAVNGNRALHAAEPGEHEVWLVAQLERAREAAQAVAGVGVEAGGE